MKSNDLFAKLMSSSESMKKYSNKILEKTNLTHGQAMVLGYLMTNIHKKITQKDIENEFMLSHATVNGFMQRMEKKGLLVTHPDSDDKRYKVVEPTKMLILQYEQAKIISENFVENLNKKMSEDEQKQLFYLLDKLTGIGKEYIDDILEKDVIN